ncbi:hypothetical protein ACHAWF_006709 [Thalassiosira exigua]
MKASTLLLAVAAAASGVASLAAAGDAVCAADDTREECSTRGDEDDSGDDDDDCVDNHESPGSARRTPVICVSSPVCRRKFIQWPLRSSALGFIGCVASYVCSRCDLAVVSCQRSCNVCEHGLEFGEPQHVPAYVANDVKEVISKSAEYMKRIIHDPEYISIGYECLNKHERCSEWALDTGCDDNPKYMKKDCAPACQSCDYLLEINKKCGLDPEGVDAIEPGGMDALFERIIRLADQSNWQPTVLSRPAKKADDNEDGTSTVSCEDGPWVVTLDNFITPIERSFLLDWGSTKGYERSLAGDEVVSARTSSQTWCIEDCHDSSLVTALNDRISHLTGISKENFEALQLLQFQRHGPRLLTFFMYFNEVTSGGGTRFPLLNNLTVEPRQSRVLIWPSVLDKDPYLEDKRTSHEAMPVLEGEKYAANAWIHTRDFQGPFLAGCPS